MTSNDLRADADRRERCPCMDTLHWTADNGPDSDGSPDYCERCACTGKRTDTMRQVERDRLLADAMDWIDRQERRDFSSPSKVPLGALLRRFAALEADNGNL